MQKTLLTDYVPIDISSSVIIESLNEKDGRILIKGTLQRANAVNQNKRKYPKPILEREAQKYMEMVTERRAMGELDHPDSSIVNLNNVSHLVVEMGWKGDDLVGVIEVLPTPAGKILEALLRSKVKVGISSRGLGTVQENADCAEVQDDFELLAFDMVSNPSTQGAFMNAVNESVDKYGKSCVNKYCRIQEIVTDILIGMGE